MNRFKIRNCIKTEVFENGGCKNEENTINDITLIIRRYKLYVEKFVMEIGILFIFCYYGMCH